MKELTEKYLQAAKQKDVQALDDIFTEDAVYIESTGATYNGLAQIKMWFGQVTAGGEVTAWDVKRFFDMEMPELQNGILNIKSQVQSYSPLMAFLS